MNMTDFRYDVLLHTLGVIPPQYKIPSRNYFNSDPVGNDYDACMALVEMGFMRKGREAEGPSVYFHATVAGIRAAVGAAVPPEDIKVWMKTKEWPKPKRSRKS